MSEFVHLCKLVGSLCTLLINYPEFAMIKTCQPFFVRRKNSRLCTRRLKLVEASQTTLGGLSEVFYSQVCYSGYIWFLPSRIDSGWQVWYINSTEWPLWWRYLTFRELLTLEIVIQLSHRGRFFLVGFPQVFFSLPDHLIKRVVFFVVFSINCTADHVGQLQQVVAFGILVPNFPDQLIHICV